MTDKPVEILPWHREGSDVSRSELYRVHACCELSVWKLMPELGQPIEIHGVSKPVTRNEAAIIAYEWRSLIEDLKKVKLKDGIPVNENDWTAADWMDFHEGIESAKAKIRARHAPDDSKARGEIAERAWHEAGMNQ